MGMTEEQRLPQRMAVRREEILESARVLFNRLGTAQVSANRIASDAGVSPGNLYYWFPNKAAIIRALFEEWSAESGGVALAGLDDSGDPGEALRAFVHTAEGQPAVTARYAFFPRELFALLHADPELAAAYRRNFEAGVDAFTTIAQAGIDAGLLIDPAPRANLRDIVVTAWIASECTPAFLEVIAEEPAPGRGSGFAGAIVRSLLTDEGAHALDERRGAAGHGHRGRRAG